MTIFGWWGLGQYFYFLLLLLLTNNKVILKKGLESHFKVMVLQKERKCYKHNSQTTLKKKKNRQKEIANPAHDVI